MKKLPSKFYENLNKLKDTKSDNDIKGDQLETKISSETRLSSLEETKQQNQQLNPTLDHNLNAMTFQKNELHTNSDDWNKKIQNFSHYGDFNLDDKHKDKTLQYSKSFDLSNLSEGGGSSSTAMSPNSPYSFNQGSNSDQEQSPQPSYNNDLYSQHQNRFHLAQVCQQDHINKYQKYFELEKEAERYKDLPDITFLVLDFNQDIYDPITNEKILCSSVVREQAFRKKLDKLMELNRRSKHNAGLSLEEIEQIQSRELTDEQIRDLSNRLQHNGQGEQVIQRRDSGSERNSKEEDAKPLSEELLNQLQAYKLKAEHFPKSSKTNTPSKDKQCCKKQPNKREQKASEKEESLSKKATHNLIKSQSMPIAQIEQSSSSTGFDFLDQIINARSAQIPNLLEKYSECCICCQKFKVNDEIRILRRCKHIFHVNCIDRWLKIQGICPIDKQKLVNAQEFRLYY